MSQQTPPNKCRYELHRRRKSKPATVTTIAEVTEGANADKKSDKEENTSMISHMHTLQQKNSELRKDMDALQLQMLRQQDVKEKLVSLQKSHASLNEKYEEEKGTNKKMIKQLQERLDDALLAKRKSEEQLLLTTGDASPATGVAKDTKSVLDDIQAKYSEEVSQLVSENRTKDKTLQEMRKRRIALVSSEGEADS
jgi:chromosome segregation ATPase